MTIPLFPTSTYISTLPCLVAPPPPSQASAESLCSSLHILLGMPTCCLYTHVSLWSLKLSYILALCKWAWLYAITISIESPTPCIATSLPTAFLTPTLSSIAPPLPI